MEYVLPAVLVFGILLFVIGWLVVIVTGVNRHPFTGILALIPGLNVLILPSIWHRVGGWVITSVVGVLLAAGAWFMGAGDQLAHHLQRFGVNIGTPAASAPAVPTPPNAAPAAAPPTANVQNLSIPPNTAATAPAPPAATTPPAETTPLALPAASSTAPTAPATATQTLALPAAAVSAVGSATTPPPAPATVPVPSAAAPATPLPPTEELPANALYRLEFKPIELNKLSETEGKYVRLTQKDGRKREGKVQTVTDTEITLEERADGGVASRPLKLNDVRQAAVMMKSQDD